MSAPWLWTPADRVVAYLAVTRAKRILKGAVDNMDVAQMKYLGPGMLVAIEHLTDEARQIGSVTPQHHTNTTGSRL